MRRVKRFLTAVPFANHDCAMSSEPTRPQRLLGKLVSPVVDAVDPDALLERVDLDELVERVDLDAALRRVDVNAMIQRVDLNAVLARVDVDALVQRIDVEAVVKRVQVGNVVVDTASQLTSRSIESARRTIQHVDAAVLRPIDRAAGREHYADRAEVAQLAGPVARMGAFLLDLLVISLSFSIVVAVGSYLVELFSSRTVDPTRGSSIGWISFGTLWGGLYFFLSWFLTQRTVGMAAFGIRLTRTDGSPVRARDSLIRIVVYPISLTFFVFGMIGIVIGRRRRALHDVAAGTLVVSDVARADLMAAASTNDAADPHRIAAPTGFEPVPPP